MTRPRIGVLHGDPNGIGPELTAKLLADTETRSRADVLVIGDPAVLRMGAQVAGVDIPVATIEDAADARFRGEAYPCLDVHGIRAEEVTPGKVSAAAGRSCLVALRKALTLGHEGFLDGFCFAPLNKQALVEGGSPFADEHLLFAHELAHDGPHGEHNVLGDLWTTRVTSHIPLKDIAQHITKENVVIATKLAHDTLSGAGFAKPRIGVCALNPHGGDGGLMGTEEIEVIGPAVAAAQEIGIAASGPYPSDTIFVKAQEGAFDAVVTMYHDQGQIAMKLMGFKRGVTVSGGLPVPITTPASGTAFDIVGRNVASADGMKQAFLLACRMGEIRGRGSTAEQSAEQSQQTESARIE